MAMGTYKEMFQHAAISHDPDVLGLIAQPQINLTVWKRANAAQNYVENLDLESLGPHEPWTDGYFKLLLNHGYTAQSPTKIRRQNERALAEKMAEKGFPDDRKGGRQTLATRLTNFTDLFAQAAGLDGAGFSLLLFRPRGHMFWHTDAGPTRGIVTLRGDVGTLWRPEPSLPAGKPRNLTYWGNVDPAKQEYTQSIDPGDMAIFKCRAAENPLVHASPTCERTRLVMIMGPR
ncbi:MAG: DUF1826 domain-containing protein [Micavibrio sp.]